MSNALTFTEVTHHFTYALERPRCEQCGERIRADQGVFFTFPGPFWCEDCVDEKEMTGPETVDVLRNEASS